MALTNQTQNCLPSPRNSKHFRSLAFSLKIGSDLWTDDVFFVCVERQGVIFGREHTRVMMCGFADELDLLNVKSYFLCIRVHQDRG